MDVERQALLQRIGRSYGTPCYVYFPDEVRARARALKAALGDCFELSYAVKSNPNIGLLRALRPDVGLLDVSSAGELQRALRSGCAPECISFSGPAKRDFELRAALSSGCGDIVCESEHEAQALSQLAGAAGRSLRILVRINPSRMPRKFGISMAGKPSQFGIDEEEMEGFLDRLASLPHLQLGGFHIYSGTNCLDEEAIAENVSIFIELFRRYAMRCADGPLKLIFGSGFGIPYFSGERALDLQRLGELINPQVDALRRDARLADARCVLEMGRWLVGPAGYLLTSVIGEKRSRGVDIRLCDAGFNNHLNACGMMGTVIRRNWPFWNVSADARHSQHSYMLVGPLCTTADVLAPQLELPETRTGDVIAIGVSGAYGLTASPNLFISHPEPREYLSADDGSHVVDVSERPATMTEPVR